MDRLFHTIYCLPLWRIVLLAVLAVIAWAFVAVLFKGKAEKYRRFLNGLLLAACVAAVYGLTLYARSTYLPYLSLTPFQSFTDARIEPEIYRSMLMNALLFVPFGMTMPFALVAKRKHKIVLTVSAAALLSTCVEMAQYFFSRGRCEIDDLLMNTFGAAVGTLSYWLYTKLAKEAKSLDRLTDVQKTVIRLLSASLFSTDFDLPENIEWQPVLQEALQQSVLPLVYFTAEPYVSDPLWKKNAKRVLAGNIRVDFEHAELDRIMRENEIPYVILKGMASAAYYPDPSLRTMGDVDFLVRASDMDKAGELLVQNGFHVASKRVDGIHIAYRRGKKSVWELHREINGLPGGKAGELCAEYFSDMLDQAAEDCVPDGRVRLPSIFHHGLIMLLHTAEHMTTAGVGLRHLCDWAVFAASLTDSEFTSLFEDKLKAIGLWRFAQLLTLLSVRYLGCPERAWASTADDRLLQAMMQDILAGGNFGKKDADRYRQIKYISGRGEDAVTFSSPLRQALYNWNQKTKTECRFVNNHKFLLPVGWIVTGFKYLGLVFSGKRKLDNGRTVTNAKQRKELYREFHLFETD